MLKSVGTNKAQGGHGHIDFPYLLTLHAVNNHLSRHDVHFFSSNLWKCYNFPPGLIVLQTAPSGFVI